MYRRHGVVAAATAAALAFASQLALGQEVYAGFEEGEWDSEILYVSGNAPTVSRDVAREGQWSLRSFLDRRNSPVSYRTEAHIIPHSQVIGRVYWVGISIYFPETHTQSDAFESVFQLHDTPDDPNTPSDKQPVFSVQSAAGIGGQYRIVGKYGSVYGGNASTTQTAFDRSVGTIKAGWNDFVFNWRWAHSPGQGGFTKVWINGEQVIDYSGPNTYNQNKGPYTKFGLYKGWHDRNTPDRVSTRLVYHDEYREAGPEGSYDMVAPGRARGAVRPKPPVFTSR